MLTKNTQVSKQNKTKKEENVYMYNKKMDKN